MRCEGRKEEVAPRKIEGPLLYLFRVLEGKQDSCLSRRLELTELPLTRHGYNPGMCNYGPFYDMINSQNSHDSSLSISKGPYHFREALYRLSCIVLEKPCSVSLLREILSPHPPTIPSQPLANPILTWSDCCNNNRHKFPASTCNLQRCDANSITCDEFRSGRDNKNNNCDDAFMQ